MSLMEKSGAPPLLVPVTVAMPPLVPDIEIAPEAVLSVVDFRYTPWLLPLLGIVPDRLIVPLPVVTHVLFSRSSAATVPDRAPVDTALILPPLAVISR